MRNSKLFQSILFAVAASALGCVGPENLGGAEAEVDFGASKQAIDLADEVTPDACELDPNCQDENGGVYRSAFAATTTSVRTTRIDPTNNTGSETLDVGDRPAAFTVNGATLTSSGIASFPTGASYYYIRAGANDPASGTKKCGIHGGTTSQNLGTARDPSGSPYYHLARLVKDCLEDGTRPSAHVIINVGAGTYNYDSSDYPAFRCGNTNGSYRTIIKPQSWYGQDWASGNYVRPKFVTSNYGTNFGIGCATAKTNVEIYYLDMKYGKTGISLGTTPTSGGGTVIYGNIFRNFGNTYKSGIFAWGVIFVSGWDGVYGTKIIENTFDNFRNTPESVGGRIHAIYSKEGHNWMISDNNFENGTGHAVKLIASTGHSILRNKYKFAGTSVAADVNQDGHAYSSNNYARANEYWYGRNRNGAACNIPRPFYYTRVTPGVPSSQPNVRIENGGNRKRVGVNTGYVVCKQDPF